MKASTPDKHRGSKLPGRRDAPRRPGCRECPLLGPRGKCQDARLKSGRCGDWVWFVLPGNKQFRRRWVKPRDPRTARQRRWRARLGAASRRYSSALAEAQRNACTAAGAKRRSRPRLNQSGPLTGQQYSVGKECKALGREERRKAIIRRAKVLQGQALAKVRLSQVPQRQRVARGTWELPRGAKGVAPEQHGRDKGRKGKDEGERKGAAYPKRRQKTALRVR